MPSSYHNMWTFPPSFSPIVCKSVESKHWWSEYFSLDAWVVAACPGSGVSLSSRPPFCLCTQLPAIHIMGGKSDIVVETVSLSRGQYYLKQTHRQNQAKSGALGSLRCNCPSVKIGDTMLFQMGGLMSLNPNRSLLTTVQLVLRHSLTQKQPGFRPQPCKGKRRRRLGRSRRPSWVRGCISDGRGLGGDPGWGKSW